MDNSQAIQNAQDELAGALLPTAPVGWPVQWLKGGNEENVYGGTVSKVEGPGRVELTVFGPAAFPKDEKGVLHESHPEHQKPNNPTTKHHGAWRYLPGMKIPKEHYDLHREQLELRLKNLIETQQRYDEAKAAREEKKAKQEQAAGV